MSQINELVKTAKQEFEIFEQTEAYHYGTLKPAKNFQSALKSLFAAIVADLEVTSMYMENEHRWQIDEEQGGIWDVMSQRWAYRGDLEDSQIYFWMKYTDIDDSVVEDVQWLFANFQICKKKKYIVGG